MHQCTVRTLLGVGGLAARITIPVTAQCVCCRAGDDAAAIEALQRAVALDPAHEDERADPSHFPPAFSLKTEETQVFDVAPEGMDLEGSIN